MTVYQIDVVSDFLCMWCYIGKRNLDRAIQLFNKTYPSNDTFALTYRPYYLNFVTPESEALSGGQTDGSAPSVPKAQIAELKLAGMSPGRRKALKARMDNLGAVAGIQFRHGGMVGRSRDAHRLVHVAASSSTSSNDTVVDALVEGIMRAFHEEERDVADRSVLRAIAYAAGMGEADVDRAFNSDDEVGPEVDEQAAANRAMIAGAGVPTYFVNGQRVDGSQDPGDWYELFVKIKEGEDTTTTTAQQDTAKGTTCP